MGTFESCLVLEGEIVGLVTPDFDQFVARGSSEQFAGLVPGQGPNFVVVGLDGLDWFSHLCETLALIKQFNNIKNQ